MFLESRVGLSTGTVSRRTEASSSSSGPRVEIMSSDLGGWTSTAGQLPAPFQEVCWVESSGDIVQIKLVVDWAGPVDDKFEVSTVDDRLASTVEDRSNVHRGP